MSVADQSQPVEFVIDREPSPISVVGDETESVFTNQYRNVNMNRRCSFCECPGHTIRTCNHTDTINLHRSAQFIFLTTIRYLRNRPNGEKTHHKWLHNLSTSELKILARINLLTSRPTREMYEEMLKMFYENYATNELRNDLSTNASPIYSMYIPMLTQLSRADFMRRYGERVLNEVILKSGRYLLDMHKIKMMFRESVIYYSLTDRQEFVRYYQDSGYLTDNNNYFDNFVINLRGDFENFGQSYTKILPTMIHNELLAKDTHDECPICYTEMTNDTMVQLGCCHSFCGDCIIGQIKSSQKSVSDCAMCRSEIKECSSASNNLLLKISTTVI
jgi:hypothetical protein